MALKPLTLIISALDRATGPIGRVQKSVGKFGRGAQRAGRALSIGLTAPIVGVGAASVKSSLDFDKALSRIVGLVKVPREQVDAWGKDLLKLGPAMGRSPVELAKGLFFVTSASFRGSKAMDILEKSAQAAAAGLGKTQIVADAVTSAMNAFSNENLSAAMATGILVATVREGKAEAGSIAPVLGRVIPVAAQLGVSFDQVGAAIASMTRLGSSAEESATALQATLFGLLKPEKKAAGLLDRIFPKGVVKALGEKGLLGVLERLRKVFKGNSEAMARVFPNVQALSGVLKLVGRSSGETKEIFEALAKATGQDLADAFLEASGRPFFKFEQALSQIKSLMIVIGDAVIPTLLPKLEELTEFAASATKWFGALSPEVKNVTVVTLALVAVLGPLMLILGGIAIAVNAINAPFLIWLGVFAGIAAAGVLILANLEKIRKLDTLIGGAVKGFFGIEPEKPRATISPSGSSPEETFGRLNRSQVGGVMTIRFENQPENMSVVRIEPDGDVDLEAEMGMSMAN